MFLFSLRLKPLAHTKKQWIWSSLYLPLFRAVLQRFSLTVGWRRHHGSPQAGGAWSAPWRLSWWEGNFAGNVLKIRRAGEWMHSNGNCRQKAMHPTRSHPERKSSIRRAGRWMSPVAISPLTQVEGEWLRAVACQRLQIRDLGWSGGSRYIYVCVCACVCHVAFPSTEGSSIKILMNQTASTPFLVWKRSAVGRSKRRSTSQEQFFTLFHAPLKLSRLCTSADFP